MDPGQFSFDGQRATLRMEDPDFGPLDRCVYCCNEFGKGRPPTDEHIVPQFAGGRVVIKSGACAPCARHSNASFETPFAQTTFHAYRLWAGFLKPKASVLLPAANGNALMAPDSSFSIELTRQVRPPMFTLLDFPPPRFWEGIQRVHHEHIRIIFVSWLDKEETIECSFGFRLDRRKRQQIVVRTFLKCADIMLQERHDIRGFYLSIAKIGYCFAIANLGFDAFDHGPIRSLLAGQRIDMATFVGGCSGTIEPHSSNSLHLVHLRLKSGIWSAIVHLYAAKQFRPYEVVLGEARQ